MASGIQKMTLSVKNKFPFSYGYVDNHHNSNKKGHIDIDWAVDKSKSVQLMGIDFVRVYSGCKQILKRLGKHLQMLILKMIDDLHLKGKGIRRYNPCNDAFER